MDETSVVSSTQNELPKPCKACVKLQSRLERALRQLERQIKFGDEIRNENEKLKQQLQMLKRKSRDEDKRPSSKRSKSFADCGSQTENSQYYTPATYNGVSSVAVAENCTPAEHSGEAVKGDPELEAAATGGGEGGEQSVAEMLRDAANECISHNGYVYDEKSGLYYDYNSGYYYDPHRKLFYEPRSGTYYAYDEESREYRFHSRENAERLKRHCERLWIQTGGQHAPPRRRTRREEPPQEAVEEPPQEVVEEPESPAEAEEGEITSEESADEAGVQEEEEEEQEEVEDGYAPCVRLMVTESGLLPVGTLFVVTAAGGSIGRATARFRHAVTLHDEDVAERAAEVSFHPDAAEYRLRCTCKAARLLLNSRPVRKADGEQPLQHRDVLAVGDTLMQVHIHAGGDTCDGCEPGVAQAQARDVSRAVGELFSMLCDDYSASCHYSSRARTSSIVGTSFSAAGM